MGIFEIGIDFNLFEIRAAKPENSVGMSPGGEPVKMIVTVQIGGHDVGCSDFGSGEKVLFPGGFCVFRLFPPGKPAAGKRIAVSFCTVGDVGAPVAVGIAEACVV